MIPLPHFVLATTGNVARGPCRERTPRRLQESFKKDSQVAVALWDRGFMPIGDWRSQHLVAARAGRKRKRQDAASTYAARR